VNNIIFYFIYLFIVNELILKQFIKSCQKLALLSYNNCEYLFNDNFWVIKNYSGLF